MHPPKRLQAILWSADIRQLDIEKDKGYIIHQVLNYGSLNDIKWLFQKYSKRRVIDIFIKKPSKNYPKVVYHFVKNYILGLKDKDIDEQNYITSIHGPVRPRAAKSA